MNQEVEIPVRERCDIVIRILTVKCFMLVLALVGLIISPYHNCNIDEGGWIMDYSVWIQAYSWTLIFSIILWMCLWASPDREFLFTRLNLIICTGMLSLYVQLACWILGLLIFSYDLAGSCSVNDPVMIFGILLFIVQPIFMICVVIGIIKIARLIGDLQQVPILG